MKEDPTYAAVRSFKNETQGNAVMSNSIRKKNPGAMKVILHNAAAHFEIRASSWFMAWMTLGVGILMTYDPTMMTGPNNAAPYFQRMSTLADPGIWRTLFLIVGTSRLMALVINGSFAAFRWTPHIRLFMSSLSAMIWANVAYSVIGGPPTIGTVTYPFLVLVEIHNAVQALKDMNGWGLEDGR